MLIDQPALPMGVAVTPDSYPPGPATRADADVRAVLSALEGLSTPADTTVEPCALPRGDRYQRLRVHARGGLGQVWLGRDELVGRDVAIKEPRTDRPGDAARTALEREAWILGRLQHPNIVPLYDLVRRADGRVGFYVMPFLDGDSLHALAAGFHRARPAGPGTRLTLLPLLTAFLEVCAALDHAHAHGVWHLDIKGDNVKLGPAGAAVVLDWGLARLAAPAAGEPPTARGSAGGTPAFMAPEQAESPAERIGPQTDVYGLGALLYLLLTGWPPHADVAGYNREELAAALRRPVVAPRRVWPGAPASLEAVCLKALAVDPANRYASVAELRADVQHWMADEPVAAYRERLAERLARWGRQHRRAVTTAVAVLLTAVVALAVGLVALDHERQQTERQRQAAEAALAQERASFRQALKAGDDYFNVLSQSPLLREPGRHPIRRELLQRGLAYYQDFLAHRGDDPALRAEVAAAWFRVGRIQFMIGTVPEELAAYRQALRLGDELMAADPGNADLRAQVARWSTRNAVALARSGRVADALGQLDRAAALAGALPETHGRRLILLALALTARSAVLDMADDAAGMCAASEQAEALYARVPLDRDSRRSRGENLVRLGQARRALNRLPAAARALRQARQIFEEMQGEPGMDWDARWGMAVCDNTIGLIATSAHDPAEALAAFGAARGARRRLVEQNPTAHVYRADLIATCLNLARHHRNHGRPDLAADASEEACTQADALMAQDAANLHFRTMAIRAYRLAAGDAEGRGDFAGAARRRSRAAELLAGWAGGGDGRVWRPLARGAALDGLRQLLRGQWCAALESLREADVCMRRARQSDQPDQRASASRQ